MRPNLAGNPGEGAQRRAIYDLTRIEGDREVLLGKLQERYGYARVMAEQALDRFLAADDQKRKAG